MGSFSLVAFCIDLFSCVFATLRAAKPLAELPKVQACFFAQHFCSAVGVCLFASARWAMLTLSPSSWESQGDG